MINKVYIKKTSDYNINNVKKSITEAFDLFGGLKVLLNGKKRVTIKLNLVMPKSPEAAATTHPSVLEAVILALSKYISPKDITIADSPGGLYNESVLRKLYSACGINEVAERTGAVLNFDVSSKAMTARNTELKTQIKKFNVIAPIANADFIINITKLKTHGFTLMTGAVKNLFGCIPGLEKAEFHATYPVLSDFSSMLTDLCAVVSPEFSIIDAVVGMEGNGPTGGTPRAMNAIIASVNPFAADLVGARLLGFKNEEIYTIRHSIERGYAPSSFEGVELYGDDINPLVVKDIIRPDTADSISPIISGFGKIKRFFNRRRPFITDKCVGCGVCAVSCPKKVIVIKNKKAVINKKNCIKCYCCQELCPSNAVGTKKSF